MTMTSIDYVLIGILVLCIPALIFGIYMFVKTLLGDVRHNKHISSYDYEEEIFEDNDNDYTY